MSRGKVHSQPQRLGTFSNSPWQHFSGNLKTGKFCLTWHRLLIFPDILMFSISLPPCKAAALIFPYAFSIVVRDSLLCTVEKSLLVHSHCSCSKLRVFFLVGFLWKIFLLCLFSPISCGIGVESLPLQEILGEEISSPFGCLEYPSAEISFRVLGY